jgi:hypothetical protein
MDDTVREVREDFAREESNSDSREEFAARAQRMLWPLVGRLQEAEDTLDAILGLMPEAPEEMLCNHAPPDLLLEIEGGIYFVLNDNLRPIIASLKRLAVVTRLDVIRHQEAVQLRAVN